VDRRGPDECWPWLGYVRAKRSGYGAFWFDGRFVPAHVFAWTIANGQMPADKPCGCHSCDVRYPAGSIEYRKCCNPSHIWPGTQADNVADMLAKGRSNPASGDRHGTRTHPESRCFGDRNGYWRHRDLVRRGEQHSLAVLTERAVREIRGLLSSGHRQGDIAATYGVTQSSISKIKRLVRWGHIA
jgi:hypothetical protein